MTALDVFRVCRTAPQTHVVAVHMEAINHCLLTREQLKHELNIHGVRERVAIPADGEILIF
jgi:hypothetical protein